MSEKSCFVIAPIGEAGSETRKRSDQVLKHVIKPAVTQCGYKPVRADQMSEPGLITSQVIQHIVDDELVVADLTERNPNVFYELAIRHAIRKPLVQLIQKGEAIPFDVAGTRTIHVDHQDLDSVEEAREEIVNQVQSLESNASDIETPISVSLDLQMLRQSDNPEQRSLADVLSVLSELRTSVNTLEKRVGKRPDVSPRVAEELMMNSRRMRHMFEQFQDFMEPGGEKQDKERTMMMHELRHMMMEVQENTERLMMELRG